MDDDLGPFHRALQDLKTKLADEEAGRARAERQLQAYEHEIRKLRAEYDGIASYLQRREQEGRSEAPSLMASGVTRSSGSVSLDGWDIYRTEAVARVLAEASEPLSPRAIVEGLAQVGRDDTMKDVAAALSHLKKRGRAMDVSRGLWTATTQELEQVHEESGEPASGPDEDERETEDVSLTMH